MKKHLQAMIAITGGSTMLLTPTAYALPARNACELALNKGALHCVAIAKPNTTGKYIKIKESKAGSPAVTKIFCATASQAPLMAISQYRQAAYQPGDQLTWQFSQCIDEDCSASMALLDDKFTITKAQNAYSSAPKNINEITLDPNYGVNCQPDSMRDSALQMRIDDAVAMIDAIPMAMSKTAALLQRMRAIAYDVANGNHTDQENQLLDNKFQTYKDQIDFAQRVNTLDGYKKISGGTLSIEVGMSSMYSMAESLIISIPDFRGQKLKLTYLDVRSTSEANNALRYLDNAITVVTTGMSLN